MQLKQNKTKRERITNIKKIMMAVLPLLLLLLFVIPFISAAEPTLDSLDARADQIIKEGKDALAAMGYTSWTSSPYTYGIGGIIAILLLWLLWKGGTNIKNRYFADGWRGFLQGRTPREMDEALQDLLLRIQQTINSIRTSLPEGITPADEARWNRAVSEAFNIPTDIDELRIANFPISRRLSWLRRKQIMAHLTREDFLRNALQHLPPAEQRRIKRELAEKTVQCIDLFIRAAYIMRRGIARGFMVTETRYREVRDRLERIKASPRLDDQGNRTIYFYDSDHQNVNQNTPVQVMFSNNGQQFQVRGLNGQGTRICNLGQLNRGTYFYYFTINNQPALDPHNFKRRNIQIGNAQQDVNIIIV